jgi:hypothetical protein
MCQQAAAPHALGTCQGMVLDNMLSTGSGNSTFDAEADCGDGSCPKNGRFTVISPRWGYTVAGAANGTCSSNVHTSYQVWAIATAEETEWIFPDGNYWALDGDGANDGLNQSSGHYFVCP